MGEEAYRQGCYTDMGVTQVQERVYWQIELMGCRIDYFWVKRRVSRSGCSDQVKIRISEEFKG